MLSCAVVTDPAPLFVVAQHDATTLHFDLRLELGGVARSWAVPKGPSLDPAVKRLAVEVADHGLDSLDFEGVHAGATRGTGAVIVWDAGTFRLRSEREGHLSFVLDGEKLHGAFALTRTGGTQWILVKMRDEAALPGSDVVADEPRSVRSGRTWQEVARGEPPAT
jgi:DNA ligase D-like protein (predicted 3'-phosphoesterase)